MEWEKLTKVKEAPKQGWILVYFRKEVLLERYCSLEEVQKYMEQGEVLELHLFDQEKEYRCIVSQSKRYPSGIIETIVDFKPDKKTTYIEKIYLETKYQKFGDKIQLLNHLRYDKDGILEVDDYRLVMEEG